VDQPSLVRKIIHIDMDAFYASIEQRDNPALRGKPVIVGGISKRGVVCAASYEARKYNIHSAMATQIARKYCPDGIFLSPRIKYYSQISNEIMNLFKEYTDLVEPLSLDEAYLDVTQNKFNIPYASTIARDIKEKIKLRIGLTASAGVGPNKFIAKISSALKKPDGLVVVPPDKVKEFIDPLPVGKIFGVGRVTESKLKKMGLHTIKMLSEKPVEELISVFGKSGIYLHNLSNGIDDRTVNPERQIKSMGEEMTFEEDLLDSEIIKEALSQLTVKLYERVKKYNIKGKTVTLKVKYHDFVQITRSNTLWCYIQNERMIFSAAHRLFSKTEIGSKKVRLIGVSLSQLLENPLYEQLLLFDPLDLEG
jgi:DNA polymerase-4